MKFPKVSLLTIMAVSLVVALNCAIIQSIAKRPIFLTRPFIFASATTLPFLNVLAVTATVRSRREREARSFLIGFEMTGWLILGSFLWSIELIPKILERLFDRAGLINWANQSTIRQLLILFGLTPAILLALQLLVATIGGLLTLWLRKPDQRQDDGAVIVSSRRRWIPLAWIVAVLAIPAAGTEVYFRFTLDPMVGRLKTGSLAVVINPFEQLDAMIAKSTKRPTRNRIFDELKGRVVRIENDSSGFVPEFIASDAGLSEFRDHRPVLVTPVDRKEPNGAVQVPHYLLQPKH